MTPPLLFADSVPTWPQTVAVLALIGSVITFICGIFVVYYMKKQTDAMIAAANKPQSIAPQPLAVELVEELHEQFASKKAFDDHVSHNTERHGQLFNRIDRVEREAREAMERRLTDLNEERKLTLEKLNAQFSFIRESIVEVKTELKHRNQ